MYINFKETLEKIAFPDLVEEIRVLGKNQWPALLQAEVTDKRYHIIMLYIKLQNIQIKLQIEWHEPHYEPRVNSCAPEG
jgi:hypothetical protein